MECQGHPSQPEPSHHLNYNGMPTLLFQQMIKLPPLPTTRGLISSAADPSPHPVFPGFLT